MMSRPSCGAAAAMAADTVGIALVGIPIPAAARMSLSEDATKNRVGVAFVEAAAMAFAVEAAMATSARPSVFGSRAIIGVSKR